VVFVFVFLSAFYGFLVFVFCVFGIVLVFVVVLCIVV